MLQLAFNGVTLLLLYTYMGQFLQDGKNVHYLSLFFKKQKARVAKPSDIDDFFCFVVNYYDLLMPLKQILTTPFQENNFFGTLNLTLLSNFTVSLTLS